MNLVLHKPYKAAPDKDLVRVPGEYLRDSSRAILMRQDVLESFVSMCNAAKKEGVEFVVVSAHRTLSRQQELFLEGEKRHGKGRAILWLAPPGYSEHHTGLAFDLGDRSCPQYDDEPGFETTAAFSWLNQRAQEFQFELSFPKNNWQKISYEPWHWRYVGSSSAYELFHPSLIHRCSSLMRAVAMGLFKSFAILSLAIFFIQNPAYSESFEKVSFESADGYKIVGKWFAPRGSKTTLILLHGVGAVKEEWQSFAEFVHASGYGVLIYDMRGHGESVFKVSGETVEFPLFYGVGLDSDWGKMIQDLALAVDFLRANKKCDPKKIVVGGASIGANIAFRYAVQNKDVPYVILLSAGVNYRGIQTDDLLLGLGPRPMLLAVSPEDTFAYQSALYLVKLSAGKIPITLYVENLGAAHGVQMFKRMSAQAPSTLEIKILQWMQKVGK